MIARRLGHHGPSTPWPTCRSSTHCSRAASRVRFCLPAGSSVWASSPTACSLAACWAAISRAGSVGPGDFRAAIPRFRPDNLARNLSLVDALRRGPDHGKAIA